MADRFASFAKTASDPGTDLVEITPDDGTDLAEVVRVLHVTGSGGLIYVDTAGGSTNVPIYVPQGGISLPAYYTRVRATGTTATGIIGLV